MDAQRQEHVDSYSRFEFFFGQKKTIEDNLFSTLEQLWDSSLRNAFGQERVFERAKSLSVALLSTKSRRTVSNLLVQAGRQHGDWSADYRTFSQAEWEPKSLFDVTKRHALNWIPAEQPIVAALDDTKLKKTGPKIPGVSYQRDPMSPPFATNFIRAQRFVQLSLSVPLNGGACSPVRAFPVAFEHAPPPRKPSRQATDEERAEYRLLQRTQNLSWTGVRMIAALRHDITEREGHARKLIVTVDGSYANQTVLKNLPAGTALIGRIRKDAKFFYPPEAQPERGRKRHYGERAPTPDELRQDDSIAWTQVEAYAAGEKRTFQIKTIRNLLWKKAGHLQPVRIVVIKPVGYRKTKHGKLFYRDPAYLICTDDSLTLQQILQAYVWRWDIEVNHRDEKQLIGVGQAQVWSQKSAERMPAFAVASYSLLLVAAALCYGLDAKTPTLQPPKWRQSAVASQPRLTTGQILDQLRGSYSEKPNFDSFVTTPAWNTKPSKLPLYQSATV